MLGLKRKTVKLTSHHKEWKVLFEQEKKLLLSIFKKEMLDIKHVGSTAILGVPAKPIIDMIVAIPSLKDVEKFVGKLKKLGYEYMKEQRFADRRLFIKGPEEKRTHHLNLVEINSDTGWRNIILFRDYIRKHKTARDKYIELKIKLAKRFAKDRAFYTEGKAKFIRSIIKKAKKEA